MDMSCADPLADGFDPTVPAPPELSSWLYLFYSYLQLEEAYSETLDWLNFTGAVLPHDFSKHRDNFVYTAGLSVVLYESPASCRRDSKHDFDPAMMTFQRPLLLKVQSM